MRGGVEREGEGELSVNFKRGLDSEGAVSTSLGGGSTCFLKG